MNKHIFCLVTILFLLYSAAFSQSDQGYLSIRGSIKVERSPLPGSKIMVYKNGVQQKAYPVDDKGKFEFPIPLNGIYEIIVAKQGYYSKKLEFNTNVPEDELGIWNYKFLMTMIPEIQGFDASLLNKPIGKIMYVDRVGEFDYDEDYTFDMLKQLDALMKLYEKARREDYKKTVAKADAAFDNKDYNTAIELYDKAIDLDPYEPYPDDQIYMIGKIIQQDENAQRKYDENIAEADNFYRQDDYINAKKYYNRALKYIENKYPKDQIVAIDDILNNQDALLADQAAKDKAYIEAVAAGDRLFVAKQYEGSLSKFNEATGIKPAEQYPKDKIAELNALIAQIANDKNSKEKIEKAYREAIAKADAGFSSEDYTTARGNYVSASQIKPAETYPKTKITEIDNILAAGKSLDEKYKGFIALADQSFTSKEYESAKKYYQQALSIRANESYPKLKIQEIDALLLQLAQKRKQDVNANYNRFIAAADASFNKKEYDASKNSYKQALGIKSNEPYPTQRIAEIDRILAELAVKKRNYDLAIARADNNFNVGKWMEAKVDYQVAATIFPEEQYPQTRLNEIENKLLAQKTATDQNKARDEAYDNAIFKADAFFAEKKYQESKNAYSQAIAVKSNEQYPKQRIAEIDQLLANKKALEEKYNALIAAADQLFLNESYPEAKTSYSRAIQLKPTEAYPKQKIAEIDALLMSRKQLGDKYNAAIAAADQQFNNKQYNDARVTYNNASQIKSSEPYPKQRIAEIDQILLSQQELAGRYNNIIATADGHFNSKNYSDAKTTYTNALQLKPNEAYPKQKIAEIDQILHANKALDTRYNAIIATADQHFISEKYKEAKTTYKNALQIKPNESYPKEKISEIDVLLASQLAAKAKYEENKQQYDLFITQADAQFTAKAYEQAKAFYKRATAVLPNEVYPKQKVVEIDNLLAGQAEKEKQYLEAIAAADQLYGAKSYGDALVFYNQASEIKPTEAHPKQRIAKINALLDKQQKDEVAYDNYITLADAAFSSNNLEQAKGQYQAANGIKPNEAYPKQRIAEIDRQLAEQARLAGEREKIESQYKTFIANADINFNQKKYQEAKGIYSQALQVKPNEMYPKERIAEIDNILQTIVAQQKAYDTKISEGANLFNANNLNGAMAAYQQALQIKPNEELPKQKIAELQSIISANAKKDEQYQGFISQADNLFSQKNYNGAKSLYQQASGVKPVESYPKNQIVKIEILLAEAAKQKGELEALIRSYNAKIAEADKMFNAKNYEQAISVYMDAKMLKGDETYPDQQIAKINQLMKNNAAKLEADYNNAIDQGDQFKSTKAYVEAKQQYRVALSLKSNDVIAKSKIAEVDILIAQDKQAADRQSKIEADYKKLRTQADNAFNSKDYSTAIGLYKSALTVKPAEQYPKDQITLSENKIQQLKALAAAEEEKRRQAELAASKSSFGGDEFDYSGEQRDQGFLSELSKQYPEGVTIENYDKKNKKIKRVIVNHSGIAKEYIEVKYSYGTFYFRNGQNISRSIFYSETKN